MHIVPRGTLCNVGERVTGLAALSSDFLPGVSPFSRSSSSTETWRRRHPREQRCCPTYRIRAVISRPSQRSRLKLCPSIPGGFVRRCPLSFFKISRCSSQLREEGMELETECDETKPPYRHIGRPPASGQDLINLSEITLVCVWRRACVCLKDLRRRTPLGCSGCSAGTILHFQLTGRPFSLELLREKDTTRLLQCQKIVRTDRLMFHSGKNHSTIRV